MQRNRLAVAFVTAGLLCAAGTAQSANLVRVESLSDMPADSAGVTIGVYVENDIQISGMVLPLEIRKSTGDAYIVGPTTTWVLNPAGRVNNSPLGAADPGGQWPAASITINKLAVPNPDNTCTGQLLRTWGAAATNPDYVSPDGVFFASVSTGDPSFEMIYLDPGADPQGTPSFNLTVNLNGSPGIFEIDTMCKFPASHLAYVDENVASVLPNFIKGRVGIETILAVKELETGVVPQDYALEQNYPNPFNAGTVIRFQQPVDGNVNITVYNVLGAKVRTLVDEFRVAGVHQTDWNGLSDDGQQVATGVYFYRITTEGYSNTRKMVLLK